MQHYKTQRKNTTRLTALHPRINAFTVCTCITYCELDFSVVQKMAEKAERRKVVLTTNEKLEIVKSIDTGTSYTIVAEKFGIARSTITDMKKDASKVETCVVSCVKHFTIIH